MVTTDLIDIVLPTEVGEDAESLVVMWYKEPGDSFEEDEILVEVQTDKAIFEMPAEFDGVLEEILVNRGEVAKVGQVMARARKAGDAVAETPASTSQESVAQVASVATSAPVSTNKVVKATPLAKKLAREHGVDLGVITGSGNGGKVTDKDVLSYMAQQATPQTNGSSAQVSGNAPKATPLAKKIAKEHKIDLNMVTGSGQGGKITDKDVRTYIDTLNTHLGTNVQVESGDDFEEIPNSGIRKATAKYMFASLQDSAQLTLSRYVDVTELESKRKELMPSTTWNDWVLRATIVALKEHKDMNAAWVDENTRKRFHTINLGMAVDTEKGLLVPVLHGADKLSFEALNQRAKEQGQKAQNNRLKSEDMNGGTFTVTNLGGLGIQFFTPILNPPQVGILGVGKLHSYVDLVDNELERKWQLPLSITFDHRAIDGAPAARFLQTIEDLLNSPEKLMT